LLKVLQDELVAFKLREYLDSALLHEHKWVGIISPIYNIVTGEERLALHGVDHFVEEFFAQVLEELKLADQLLQKSNIRVIILPDPLQQLLFQTWLFRH